MTPPQAVVPVASLPTTIANPASHRKTSQPDPSGPCADNTLILGLESFDPRPLALALGASEEEASGLETFKRELIERLTRAAKPAG